ncbi:MULTISPECIES: hypothetical protein [unclassified Nonomuraea]|uniref:hypothetical protein n=1 Tax=unclassified Nonomuraea TaxID=2593643 RepID=UPI0033F179AA
MSEIDLPREDGERRVVATTLTPQPPSEQLWLGHLSELWPSMLFGLLGVLAVLKLFAAAHFDPNTASALIESGDVPRVVLGATLTAFPSAILFALFVLFALIPTKRANRSRGSEGTVRASSDGQGRSSVSMSFGPAAAKGPGQWWNPTLIPVALFLLLSLAMTAPWTYFLLLVIPLVARWALLRLRLRPTIITATTEKGNPEIHHVIGKRAGADRLASRDAGHEDRGTYGSIQTATADDRRVRTAQRWTGGVSVLALVVATAFNTSLWLPTETIRLEALPLSVKPVVGHVLAVGEDWTTLLRASDRMIFRVKTSTIASRQVCTPSKFPLTNQPTLLYLARQWLSADFLAPPDYPPCPFT